VGLASGVAEAVACGPSEGESSSQAPPKRATAAATATATRRRNPATYLRRKARRIVVPVKMIAVMTVMRSRFFSMTVDPMA
jgi:hypothetical protein